MLQTRSRWVLCVFLLLGTTINYLDRQTLSLLAPMMRQELALNNESLGLLFSLFYYAYTAAQFSIGGLMDRANLRWAYGCAVLLWSAVGMLTATASGFAALAVFRVLLGFTEAPNWPGALKIVSRALPERERPLGNGIFTSGQSIGALAAPLIILSIAGVTGWRMGFVAVGAIGAAWFVGWVWFTQRSEFAQIWPPQGQGGGLAGYREVLAEPRFRLVAVVTSCVNPILYFNVNWLPTYFNQQRGMAAGSGEMKWILTLVFLALDLGYLAFGFACLHVSRKVVFSVATVLVACAAGVPFAADRNVMVALLAAAHFGLGMWMSMYLTFTQEVSRHSVSTAMGLAGGTGSLAGAVLMWLVGVVTERTHSFVIPFAGVAVLIVVAWAAAMAGSSQAGDAGRLRDVGEQHA